MTSTPASPPNKPQRRSQPIQPTQSVPASPKSQPAQKARRKRLQADRSGVLSAAGIMAGISWVLLYLLVTGMKPLAFGRWLFFILVYIAITGTALPLLWYLNQRFSRVTPVTGGLLLRQGMGCGPVAPSAALPPMNPRVAAANGSLTALGH